MHSWIELNKEALLKNVSQFESWTGSKRVLYVVKGNAYGHGLLEVASLLRDQNIRALGTNSLDEVHILREKANIKLPILNVGPVFPWELETFHHLNTQVTLGSQETVKAWVSLPRDKRPAMHLKIDSGLSRQGLSPSELPEILSILEAHKDQVVGVSTHFANVEDVSEHDFARKQLRIFGEIISEMRSRNFQIETHAASSAATLILPEAKLDFCRVGISLYGLWPSRLNKLSFFAMNPKDLGSSFQLSPVLSWKAPVANVRQISPGTFVGYGLTFKASRPTTVALLSVGYEDGYTRMIGQTRSHVLIQGAPCPILGTIAMNMMMIDITALKHCAIGETATLLGTDGSDKVTAEQLAAWSNTISYEVVTKINPRLKRHIV